MDQADSPQLQGDRSIRFCTRVLLNMRYKWHRRWLVRAAAGRGGEKKSKKGWQCVTAARLALLLVRLW